MSGESSMMVVIGRCAAQLMCLFCLVFAFFQVALVLGVPLGAMTWGGSEPVLSGAKRTASAWAAGYLVLAAALMLVRSGDLRTPVPPAPVRLYNGFLLMQMILNTAANLLSSNPQERLVMGGASALGAVLALLAVLPTDLRRAN